MRLNRPLRTESLECRRLLAAGLDLNTLISTLPAGISPEAIASIERIAGGDVEQLEAAIGQAYLRDRANLRDRIGDEPWSIAPTIFPGLNRGPDLIQEVGNRLFVVDQASHGVDASLVVFERTASGELETLQEIEIGVPIRQMIVEGDRVVLIGNSFGWGIFANANADAAARPESDPDVGRLPNFLETVAITVSFGDEVNVTRQTLPQLSHTIQSNGDTLAVVSTLHEPIGTDPPALQSQVSAAIFPGDEIQSRLTVYQITDNGLVETSSSKIPTFALTELSGDNVYIARTQFDSRILLAASDPSISAPERFEPSVSVQRYAFGDDGIRIGDPVELGPGFLTHFDVAADGLTGVAVVQRHTTDGSVTTISLLDLSDGIKIFESIQLDGYHWSLGGGTNDIVLRNWNDETLAIVNTDQSIDIDAESRIRLVSLPEGVHVDAAAIRLGDRLVLHGRRVPVPDPNSDEPNSSAGGLTQARLEDPFLPVSPSSVLVVISVSSGEVESIDELADPLPGFFVGDWLVIDAEAQRFAYVARTESGANGGLQLVYGRLTDSGEFQRDGALPVEGWLEVDATAERLIVRLADRIEEFTWADATEPSSQPFPLPRMPLNAVDDEFRRRDNGRDHLLNVIANDVASQHRFLPDVSVVDLIGAPEGTEIVGGRAIRIPATAMEGTELIDFGYVISDGEQSSEARIVVHVVPELNSERHDSNGDGVVSARDALVVINFLGNFGTMELEELPEMLGLPAFELQQALPVELDAMTRYDTDGSGEITALDALIVINRLAQPTVVTALEPDELERAIESPPSIHGIDPPEKI